MGNQSRNNGSPVNGAEDISPNYEQYQQDVRNLPQDPIQFFQQMEHALVFSVRCAIQTWAPFAACLHLLISPMCIRRHSHSHSHSSTTDDAYNALSVKAR